MSHALTCITNVLDDVPSCTIRGEHLLTCTGHRASGKECKGCEPRTATHGDVCDRCYTRIDHAIQTAVHLHTALAGVEHAVVAEGGGIAVGYVPLNAIRLALDEIDRARDGHEDPTEWVSTEEGAIQAVRFAKYVHAAERAHPTLEATRKLHRLRCPDCNSLTAIWQPPEWAGDDIDITCIRCGWTATHPNAPEIVASIELKGLFDIRAMQKRGAA